MNYSFSCETCGEEFDKQLPMSSAQARPNCPKCQSDSTRRTFHVAPMVVIYNEDRFTKQLSRRGKEIWNKSKRQVGL